MRSIPASGRARAFERGRETRFVDGVVGALRIRASITGKPVARACACNTSTRMPCIEMRS